MTPSARPRPVAPTPQRLRSRRSDCSRTRAGWPWEGSILSSAAGCWTSWASERSSCLRRLPPPCSRGTTSTVYAGASAQNRAVADFCAADPRLLAVAFVPLVDPERALRCAQEAIVAGCAAVMVPSTAAGERAPTHPELDGFWDLLDRSDVPFVLHV